MSAIADRNHTQDVVRNSAATPIDLARSYVYSSVLEPALASSIDQSIKEKVKNSCKWISRFKRVGDLLAYLKRFNVADEDPVYRAMKKLGLLTFEDIVDDFEKKFGQWAEDCSRISDFVIGEEYSVYDILILAKSYDTRSGGMFVLEALGRPTAVVIKATLSGGMYENAWVREFDELKYYLKSISGNFGLHFKTNKAILDNHELPVVTFVRKSDDDPFVFHGLFKYQALISEDGGAKAFILKRFTPQSVEVFANAKHFENDLRESVSKSLSLTAKQRAERLASASKRPAIVKVVTSAFVRNPDVIAEVLIRADGYCERCKQPAPFMRRSNNTPYLEVHHNLPLANGGEDTVENAIALCPNCHREMHYGLSPESVHQKEQLLLSNDPFRETDEFIE